MPEERLGELSRRERQIIHVLYASGEIAVGEILERIEDPPSYSAIRATLRILENKGHVEHIQDGPRYLYRPTVTKERARSAALKQLVGTFFEGSAELAAAALVQMSDNLTDTQRDRIAQEIEKAKGEGR